VALATCGSEISLNYFSLERRTVMSIEIPEGFKLIPRKPYGKLAPKEVKQRRYAVSEKGDIFDVTTGMIHVAPEGGTIITIREESPGRQYEASFDIPILLKKYFGK
jgi:hypothetical protein